jgi:hypothetical protein
MLWVSHTRQYYVFRDQKPFQNSGSHTSAPNPALVHFTECNSCYWQNSTPHAQDLPRVCAEISHPKDSFIGCFRKSHPTGFGTRQNAREPIKNPSKRTPNTPFMRNYADRIEKAFNKAGFRSWGFPIYRCTYQSDSDWAEFLRRYRRYVSESLKEYNV